MQIQIQNFIFSFPLINYLIHKSNHRFFEILLVDEVKFILYKPKMDIFSLTIFSKLMNYYGF
jgi:hypothetical protein